jgi:hypothetical protein
MTTLAHVFLIVAALHVAAPSAAQIGLPPSDGPVAVDVGVYLLDVTEIREIESTFMMEGYMALRWRDPRLATERSPEGAAPRVYTGPHALRKLGEIWWPDLLSVNSLGSSDFQRIRLLIGSDGTVDYTASVSARLKGDFDFRNFPFDRQQLGVVMQSYAWDASQVELRVDTERTGISPELQLAEWKTEGLLTSVGRMTDPRDARSYSRFAFELGIERKSVFYLWKVILPLLLLVVLSWSVFWMSDEPLARRTGVTLTTLLTVVAYQFIVSEALPRLAYLTHLDSLMLLSFAFIAATAIVNWSVIPTQRDSAPSPIDRTCRWLFPVGYAASIVATFAFRSVSPS